jgi:hypothetical protein
VHDRPTVGKALDEPEAPTGDEAPFELHQVAIGAVAGEIGIANRSRDKSRLGPDLDFERG